jgi:hypothetical protein
MNKYVYLITVGRLEENPIFIIAKCFLMFLCTFSEVPSKAYF